MAKKASKRPTKVQSAKEIRAGLRAGGRAGLRAGLTPGALNTKGLTLTQRRGGKIVTTTPRNLGGRGTGKNSATGGSG